MKTRIAEEDVLESYSSLIKNECRNSYKALEFEDRVAECNMVLLHCIRTYKSKYGDFENYFIFQLRRKMPQINKKAWAAKRVESQISLDAPIRNGNYTLHDCLGKVSVDGVDDFLIDFKSFKSILSPKEHRILSLRYDDYSFKFILNTLKVTVSDVYSVLNSIKLKYEIFSASKTFPTRGK